MQLYADVLVRTVVVVAFESVLLMFGVVAVVYSCMMLDYFCCCLQNALFKK